ncbi:unnamed protein product [Paramecium sonneborni]|uniref:Uncharacterized protein n=1 Tax=Paramecium sonneborni TaxID=65129 RepID=A0A8S1MNM2_9CILI|nr:unnamed protein product [Paramecium sonneborni]
MKNDDRNQEINDQEIENEKLREENKILNQELSKVQCNQEFVSSSKYDHRTVWIKLQAQKFKKKIASELKFCVFQQQQVLEITGLIQEIGRENQIEYYLFSQRINLPKAVTGQPKIIQTEEIIEIIYEVQKPN